MGHDVSVITPADDDASLPPYIVSTGRAVPVPYNGAVARMAFGPLSARRVRRWLRDGNFDVVHVHEPTTPSLSLLATWSFDGPLVATFHTSVQRARTLAAAYPILQTALEKISARIAVSVAARRTLVEHLGGDAVLIPNGVSMAAFADVEPFPGWPGEGGALGFLGRFEEARKGPAGAVGRVHPARRQRGRDCACSSPGRATPTRSGGSCRLSSFAGWSCSGRSATPTKRACCGRSMSTSLRTRAAKALASCCSKRWPPERRCWPAISRRFGPCSLTAPPVGCSPTATPTTSQPKAAELLDDAAGPRVVGRSGEGDGSPV